MNALRVQSNTNGSSVIKADSVLVQGDLGSMDENQRAAYYLRVCESLGLNPHTQPFEFIKLNGQLKLYATRACSDQLRKIHGVSITIHSRELVEDIYTVVARAEDASGRTDESSGVVTVKGLSGEARANALMKAETKAKRRVTLSICGLGWLDETEVESVQAVKAAPAPVKIAALPAPVKEPEKQSDLSEFRELCLAVENNFPGTLSRMLKHYKVDSVEAMHEQQMTEAKKNLKKKLEVK